MSASESTKPAGYALEKKISVTEDLRIPTTSTKSEDGATSTAPIRAVSTTSAETKRSLENIKEGEVATIPVATAKQASKTDNAPKLTVSAANPSQTQQQQPTKTFAEITQELKHQLRKTSSEIEKSDIEFDRLIGNLEKRIEALRVQLDS